MYAEADKMTDTQKRQIARDIKWMLLKANKGLFTSHKHNTQENRQNDGQLHKDIEENIHTDTIRGYSLSNNGATFTSETIHSLGNKLYWLNKYNCMRKETERQ